MSKHRSILVIQVDVEGVRAAIAEAGSDAVHIKDCCNFPSSTQNKGSCPLFDQLIIDQLKSYCRGQQQKTEGVLFVLGGAGVSSHYLDMPPLSGKELTQATRIKLAQQLHFPVAEAVVAVKSLKSPSGGQLRVHATAGIKSHLDTIVDTASQLGLRLLGICAASDVLSHAVANRFESTSGMRVVLDLGEQSSTLVVVDGGTPCICSEIPVSAGDMTIALMRPIIRGEEVVQLDAAQAMQLRDEVGVPLPGDSIPSLGVTGDRILPLLEPVLQKLLKQMTQWLTFATTGKDHILEEIELIGVGAAIPQMGEAIAVRSGLRVSVSNWLDELAIRTSASGFENSSGYGLCAAAVRHWKKLPDLVPEDVRRDERTRRWRRSVSICAPIIAVSIAAMSVPFESLGSAVEQSVAVRKAQLAVVQSNVDQCGESTREDQAVTRVEGKFRHFVDESPDWLAVLKEQTQILPRELRATEYSGEWSVGGASLTVRGEIVTADSNREFDDVVRQTVLALQKSELFRRVEIVSANQGASDRDAHIAGSVAFRLDLRTPVRDGGEK
jgi:Tfp pilus assembly PilM family ATPase